MLAQPKLTSSDSARNYFEQDTYYINNAYEQGSFYGKLKEDLGLGEFNLADFDKLLMGQNLEGEQLLRLTSKDFDESGERKRAACDLTFAADKDISILYEVSDDEMKNKIRAAFNRSIDKSLDFAEANYSYTKDRNNMKGKKAESKMLFTRFDHSESRNDDMHLHVHCLAMNMIKDENGNWKAVEFNQIMENHQLLGQIQRNEFAKELQALGVELEISSVKNGTFKTKNVEQEIRDMFSTRSKDIKEEMAKSGQTSYKATHTAQKQTAKWKDKNKDREQIQADNIQRLEEAGADIEKIKELKEGLEIRQLDERAVVEIAISDLTDKKSVFKKEDVLKHALKVGLLSNIDVNLIAHEFEKYHDLFVIDREKNQFTTLEVLEKEEFIFNLKNEENFSITQDKTQIATAISEFESKKGFTLKSGQTELANTILTSDNKFIVAQGVAGAGKSTSLEIVKNVAEQNGINVVALAPTGTATDNLASEAGIKQNMTVAKFIQENGNDIKDSLVIVDEAGMMGLRDTHDLMKIAEANNLKIVFSGDMNQKKSISQGDIFAGMQRQGFETVSLAEGNRQKNEKMRLAVKNILDRDIVAGLDILKDTTYEVLDRDERLLNTKEEYLKDRANSLLITTTNRDRVELNEMIRNHLVETKEIRHSKKFRLRETINLSDLEKRSALHYKVDQKMYLSERVGAIAAGREAVIKDVDLDGNKITIEHMGKNKVFTEIVDLTQNGNKLNLFEDVKKDLGIGDQIMMKKNDKKLGLSNGQMGTITDMYKDRITVKFEKKEVTFSTNQYKYINYAYAITDYNSQGKTTDKVIAVANSQAASFNDFYTQITRAKHEAVIITDNLKELQERAARDSVKLNAKELIQEKLEKENKMKQEQQDRYYDGYSEFIEDEFGDEIEVTASDKYFDFIAEEHKIWDYPRQKLGKVAEQINTKFNMNWAWDISAAIEMKNRGIEIQSIESIENISRILRDCDFYAQENDKGSKYLMNLVNQTLDKYVEAKKLGHMSFIEVYHKMSEMYEKTEISPRLDELRGNNIFYSTYSSKLGLEPCEITKKELDSLNEWELIAAIQMNNRDIAIKNMDSIKSVTKLMIESEREAREQGKSFKEMFDEKMTTFKGLEAQRQSISYLGNYIKKEINHDILKNYDISKENNITTYTNQKTGVQVEDKGNALSTNAKNDLEAAQSLIEVARAKGWDMDKLKFGGPDEFKRIAEKELKAQLQEKELAQTPNVQQEKEEKRPFIETIDKASDLYDLVETARDVISGDINEVIKNIEDLEIVGDMAINHSMQEIDAAALDSFKELAVEVYQDAVNGDLDFSHLMQDVVKISGKFEKQLAHSKTLEQGQGIGD